MAESGKPTPVLRLTTASHLIVGRPTRSSALTEAGAEAIRSETKDLIGKTVRRRERGSAYQDLMPELEATWAQVSGAPEPDAPSVLTLIRPVCWGWGDSFGLRPPVLRVRLDAITAWWVGKPAQIDRPKDRGFAGFFFWSESDSTD